MKEINIDKEFLGVVELPEKEYIDIKLTIEDLTLLHQVMGFVVPNSIGVINLMDKLRQYTDEELIEDLFGKVYVTVDSDLPLLKQDFGMQENNIEIKLGK